MMTVGSLGSVEAVEVEAIGSAVVPEDVLASASSGHDSSERRFLSPSEVSILDISYSAVSGFRLSEQMLISMGAVGSTEG